MSAGRIAKWWRRWLDKVRGRFYEGPDPPARIMKAAAAFAVMNREATVEDWIMFAAEHAAEAYRSGYVRGLEWNQRAKDRADPGTAPALEAEAESAARHNWSWVDLAPAEAHLNEMVATHAELVDRLSPEDRMLYMDLMGRNMAGFKVALLPAEDPKKR